MVEGYGERMMAPSTWRSPTHPPKAYSPYCLEAGFSELHLYRVLRRWRDRIFAEHQPVSAASIDEGCQRAGGHTYVRREQGPLAPLHRGVRQGGYGYSR